MNGIETTAMATAGIGGLTAFWSQLSGFLSRLRSLFIVSVDVYGNLSDHFLLYCWNNFKPVSLGDRAFVNQNRYVIPKKSYKYVAYERSGKFQTFFLGWRPLLVSTPTSNDGSMRGSELKVSFIRGTFDIEKLLIQATDKFNRSCEGNKYIKRFFVRKVFGLSGKTDGQSLNKSPSGESPDSYSGNGMKPLGYDFKDIGIPKSEHPFENLAYEQSVMEFKEEIVRWQNSKEWFESKGIPWRFGAGLFGPPGTGKSSFIKAVAQELDFPVHVYDLTTMSNKELVDFWKESLLATPCMVVFEDIDRVFDKDKLIKSSNLKDPLTLDCLLNCINGIEPADGILVMVTANDVSKVDPALGVPDSSGNSTRPGRLDRAVYFGTLNVGSRVLIAKRILSDCPDLIDQTVQQGEGDSGAQFENRCAKIALAKKWGGFKVYS